MLGAFKDPIFKLKTRVYFLISYIYHPNRIFPNKGSKYNILALKWVKIEINMLKNVLGTCLKLMWYRF